jgi:hypothetical protein
MRAILVAAACAAALSGCATLSADDCRNADWYRIGDRDGISGSQSLVDQYRQMCSAHSVKVDDGRYLEGWRDGVARKRTQRF